MMAGVMKKDLVVVVVRGKGKREIVKRRLRGWGEGAEEGLLFCAEIRLWTIVFD